MQNLINSLMESEGMVLSEAGLESCQVEKFVVSGFCGVGEAAVGMGGCIRGRCCALLLMKEFNDCDSLLAHLGRTLLALQNPIPKA